MQLHLIKNNSWLGGQGNQVLKPGSQKNNYCFFSTRFCLPPLAPWQGNPGKKPLSPPRLPELTIKRRLHATSKEISQLNCCSATDLPEKFANLLMKNGGKLKAYNILYTALKILYIKTLNVLNSTYKQGAVGTMYVYKKSNKNHTQMKNRLSFPEKKTSSYYQNASKKQLLFKAINNVKPSVEVRSVKVAGRTHQVPSVISQKRQQALAIRSIIQAASNRKKNSTLGFSECLATELFEALNNSGKIKQKRDALHKTAELNRASIRFKWW